MKLMDGPAVKRLEKFFEDIGALLGSDSRRASFATYAMGLLSDGERKSVEPMSSRACPDPSTADAAHQRLLHFVGIRCTDPVWWGTGRRCMVARWRPTPRVARHHGCGQLAACCC